MIISGKQVNKKCYGRVINYRLSVFFAVGKKTLERGTGSETPQAYSDSRATPAAALARHV